VDHGHAAAAQLTEQLVALGGGDRGRLARAAPAAIVDGDRLGQIPRRVAGRQRASPGRRVVVAGPRGGRLRQSPLVGHGASG
jgi:hypothetical protein